MKLLINTSAVPFNHSDQRTICRLGVGMSSRSNRSDRNAGDFVGRSIGRRKLARRYGVPRKTSAEWASN
jgi:hypothetical protein